MAEYYVVRDKNTGLYFRGKGVNRWGKYYNQASIYRIRANAENTIKEVSWRGEQAEVVPIQIVETTADAEEVKHGKWLKTDAYPHHVYCSLCYRDYVTNEEVIQGRKEWQPPAYCTEAEYCPHCGAKMDEERT